MRIRQPLVWPSLVLPGAALRAILSPRYHNHCLPQPCHLSTVSTSSQHGSISSSHSWNTTFSPSKQLQSTSITSSPSHALKSLSSTCHSHYHHQLRHASSSSNSRWQTRQKTDRFAREAKTQNLKSRAAFKLLQINDRYRIFRPGQTVVDLGFAPGSWSQVAIDLVRPGLGRVVGVDIIPVAPPRGVNGLQGDFLSPETQARVRDLLRDENAGRARRGVLMPETQADVIEERARSVDPQRGTATATATATTTSESASEDENLNKNPKEQQELDGRVVDVVLSDMSAPWEITSGLWKNSLSNPYYRMMNTSGNRFKDHAGSMDLCRSALYFAYETLKVGGHFVCKFYQGAEDKAFEKQMKSMFHKVHREKPESSRSESKEAFFVGIRRLARVERSAVFDEGG